MPEISAHEDEYEAIAGEINPLDAKARWNVTDLTEFSTCPGRTHHKYVLHELGKESIPIALGTLEHSVRSTLTKKLLGIYVSSDTLDEIISQAYPAIDSCVQEALRSMRDTDCIPKKIVAKFGDDLKVRLSKEEDLRAYKAGYLLRKGLSGADIIKALLPSRVEYPVCSDKLTGRIDAIFEFGNKSVPIEYKTCGFWPGLDISSWEIQLAAYCILLSESTKTAVDYGILYFTRTLTEIPVVVTDALRRKVDETIGRMEELVQNGQWSGCNQGNKCTSCSYSEFCSKARQQPVQTDRVAFNIVSEKMVKTVNVYDRIMSQGGSLNLFDNGGDVDE